MAATSQEHAHRIANPATQDPVGELQKATAAKLRSIHAQQQAADELKEQLRTRKVLQQYRRATDPLLRWARLNRIRRWNLAILRALVVVGMASACVAAFRFLPGVAAANIMITMSAAVFVLLLMTATQSFIEADVTTMRGRIIAYEAFELFLVAGVAAYILVPAIYQGRLHEGVYLASPLAGVASAVWLWRWTCTYFHTALSKPLPTSPNPVDETPDSQEA
ncbi:hypothetical protein [Nocardia sp. NPDC003726]